MCCTKEMAKKDVVICEEGNVAEDTRVCELEGFEIVGTDGHSIVASPSHIMHLDGYQMMAFGKSIVDEYGYRQPNVRMATVNLANQPSFCPSFCTKYPPRLLRNSVLYDICEDRAWCLVGYWLLQGFPTQMHWTMVVPTTYAERVFHFRH